MRIVQISARSLNLRYATLRRNEIPSTMR